MNTKRIAKLIAAIIHASFVGILWAKGHQAWSIGLVVVLLLNMGDRILQRLDRHDN